MEEDTLGFSGSFESGSDIVKDILILFTFALIGAKSLMMGC